MSHVDDGTLHAYLDGELSPPEAQAVDAHVAQCPACRTRLEEERALVARAGELLARAAPPDRELPPFRPGDVKPPARLWWHVRTPLAWAATIALALGIGTYLGGYGGRRMPDAPPTEVADRLAQNAPASVMARTPDSAAALKKQSPPPEHRGRVSQPAVPQAPVPAVEEKRQEESIPQASADSSANRGSNALAAREASPMVAAGRHMAAKAGAAAPPGAEYVSLGEGGYAVKGGPIGLDSARLLLGGDVMALPDVPIRDMYRARMIGYSAIVIVEQALDSSTVIDVINKRASPLQLSSVVVSAQGSVRADSLNSGAQAWLGHRADSLAATPKLEPAPRAKKKEAERMASERSTDVRGPLPPDSLAALRRLLRPLRP